jgi:hypothetical protein
MEDENINDGLNSDDFSDFLGKYKDYFEKNKPNHNDLSFLDKKEHPSDAEVIELFVTPDDMDNSVDISNYDLGELGMPNAVKSLEGTEWRVSKMVWFKPEGRVISFALIKMDEYEDIRDEVDNMEDFPWFPISGVDMGDGSSISVEHEEFIDIDHEEVEDEDYITMLENAIEDEDYAEAARLRDWLKTLDVMISIAQYLSKGSKLKELFEKLDEINKHKKTL